MFAVRNTSPRPQLQQGRLQVTAEGRRGKRPTRLAACVPLAPLEEDHEERRDFGVQKTPPRNVKNADGRAPQCLMQGERGSGEGRRTTEPPAGGGQLGGGEKAGKEV